jgi:hypothetical protein
LTDDQKRCRFERQHEGQQGSDHPYDAIGEQKSKATSAAPAQLITFISRCVQFIVPQFIEAGKVAHTGRAALGVTVTSVDAQLSAQDNLAVEHSLPLSLCQPDGEPKDEMN